MKESRVLMWLLFAFCGSAFCNCPSTWHMKDNKCFKVINTKRSWNASSTDCQNQLNGAHLIYLNDRPISFTDTLANILEKDYFVGAKRINGSWFWGNGVKVVKKFNKHPGNEKVYVVLQQGRSHLSAKKSSSEAFYICESSNHSLHATTTRAPSSTALPSWPTATTVDTNNSTDLNNILTNSFIQNITRLDFKKAISLNVSVDMMQHLLTSIETNKVDKEFEDSNLMLASKRLEEFSMKYAKHHLHKGEIWITRGDFAVFRAKKVFPTDDDYTFQIADSQDTIITVPKENYDKKGSYVVSMSFKQLNTLMTRKQYNIRSNRFDLQSRILPTTIDPAPLVLKKNVTLKFTLSKVDPAGDHEKLCVFWKFPTPFSEKNATGWSSDGCTLVKLTDQYVECSCNHLTHFAVLMQVKDDQVPRDHDVVLTIITNIGLGLSIVGCILTFLAYWRFTDVKSEQSQIRMNLVFVLAVAHILFLLGSAAKSNIILCISVAALMQLFYTSALCWMFAEGIQLYMQVIKVFNTNLKMRQVYGFAWGFPLLLITVSLSIAGNGSGGLSSFVNDDFCWLSVDNHLIWTFIAPVILLILSNLIVLGMVLKEMNSINQPIGDKQGEIPLRSSVKALIVLAPLLGVTWLMGLLCILGADVIGMYIFTILNSIQGFLIFVFHCWRNSEIQGKFRRKIQSLEENRSKQDDVYNVQNYRHRVQARKEAFTLKMQAISKVPKPRKQSPGGLTLSDFDASDFMNVQFKPSAKL